MKAWNTVFIITYIQLILIGFKIAGASTSWFWILAPTWGSIVFLGFMIVFISCVIADVDTKDKL